MMIIKTDGRFLLSSVTHTDRSICKAMSVLVAFCSETII
uniref:Uncharacterized protein n=1 Tax=Anguilla anguilla TaxID=7936 RepID=A0A0E9P7I5_ANGAN